MRHYAVFFVLFALLPFGVRAENPAHAEFYTVLHDEYVKLANDRDGRSFFDGGDADAFRQKAKLAKRHSTVRPDAPSDRVITSAHRPLLKAAFDRLANAMARGARHHAGIETAIAQVSYDCWLEATEGKRTHDAAACRDKFESAIADAETMTQIALNAAREAALDDVVTIESVPVVSLLKEAVSEAETPSAAKPLTYAQIPFDVSSTILNPAATELMDTVIQTARDNPTYKISIRAHADKSGAASVNTKLARARADAVVEKLASAGIEGDRLHMVEAVGASRLGQRIVEIDLRP